MLSPRLVPLALVVISSASSIAQVMTGGTITGTDVKSYTGSGLKR